MDIGNLLKAFIIILGVVLLMKAVLSLAKRKMTEPFCLVWAILSCPMIIAGLLFQPYQLDHYVSKRVLILILLMVLSAVWGLWFISTQVSILMRRNQELAMQLSLLNQDSEKLMKELKEIKEAMNKESLRSDEQ